jgi:hypothetical protein
MGAFAEALLNKNNAADAVGFFNMTPDSLSLEVIHTRHKAKLFIRNLRLSRTAGKIKVSALTFDIAYTIMPGVRR